MKTRVKIIAMILSIIVCSTVWLIVKAVEEEPKKLTFDKYYEFCELNIKPNAPGYTLPLDINDIVNFNSLGSHIDVDSVSDLIRQNGFAILELPNRPFCDDIEFLYESISDMGIPVFVTIDTLLHIYHIQFEWAIRDIEECKFVSAINDLTDALFNYSLELYDQLDGNLKEAARRNVAYLSVAQRLIDPDRQVPELVEDIVTRELDKIDAHRGSAASDIFIYQEDYSQYVPRSHYAWNDKLQRYFKTMMWYGRMAFLFKGGPGALISQQDAKIQTLQAFLLTTSLYKARIGKRTALEIWDRIHEIMSFFVGVPDDLTPYDYLSVLNKVLGRSFKLTDLDDPHNLQTLKTELELLPSPKILGSIGDPAAGSLEENLVKTRGMRLMGQRFVPDSYMFQRLVFPKVSSYIGDSNTRPFTYGVMGGTRFYPRGLDVMALLGSPDAKQILINEGDTDYVDYCTTFGGLKSELDQLSLTDWNRNIYWSWLYTLKSLLRRLPEGYPNFMRTSAWQKRQLHVALASWTELRHDTNLYAKMSGWPAGLMLPTKSLPPTGYVEPVPVFWGRLLALTRMTIRGLTDLNALSPEGMKRLNALEDVLSRLITIVTKQLENQMLSEDDYAFIKNFSASLEPMTLGIPPTHLKTTLVADVHTNGPEGLIVEEAVGKLDLIVVACSAPNGSIYLAAGPVLSYYEFKHQISDRLSDESWQLLHESPYKSKKPDRPKWYVPLMGLSSADAEPGLPGRR